MKVAVVDHGMGNLRSVAKAMEAAGMSPVVTSVTGEIDLCDALCVPGQGIFGRCMSNMAALGLTPFVRSWIADGRPYLGICLGLQILFEASEEGGVEGLGILGGRVKRLDGPVKVPHIGWNEVAAPDGDREDVAAPVHYYFDHSFAVDPSDPQVVRAWCTHGRRFAAVVESGSITGVQFHPEKSGRAGLELLAGWGRAA